MFEKNINLLGLVVCLVLIPLSSIAGDQAVTYTFSGGRFGDQLLSYMHAKWISYHYKIPLIYQPFAYSDSLALHKLENTSRGKFTSIHRKIRLGEDRIVDPSLSGTTLYVASYFPETPFERNHFQKFVFDVDWEDADFRNELKKVVSPIISVPPIDIPPGRIPVAVHVRRGGGFDGAKLLILAPEKFPPNDYYVKQIRKIYEWFGESPLYLHIFTDDTHPALIATEFEKELKGLNVTFGFREKKNFHNRNVVEDFFAMAKFQALIRPDSNYSITVEKIADYQIVISPAHVAMENGIPVIDQVNIVTRRSL